MEENKCPLMKSIGDVDFCKETERPSGRIKMCLLITGEKCETLDDIRLIEKEDELRELKREREEKDWDMFRDRY